MKPILSSPPIEQHHHATTVGVLSLNNYLFDRHSKSVNNPAIQLGSGALPISIKIVANQKY